MMKKRGEASDIRIDDLPLKLDSEIQNMAMHGTVSTGKSTLMRKILKQLRDRGDLVIIYDKGCTFVEDFYDESRDKVLNALDSRCPNWDLWEECRSIAELENASTTLIPASSGEDPFWQGSARTIFAEGAERMRKDEDRSYNKFLRTLLAIKLDQLRAFLAGTPASTLVDGKIEKTAISIRSVLTNYVKALRYLQGIDRPGREKFTIREWMKGQTDKSKNGWLFITSDEQNHESLKPLISLWLSIAATSLLAMGPNRQRRVWFFYDELASLHKLSSLPRIISEARKFGGCFVLGFQNIAQMEEIYGPKAAAGLFDLLNTKFFFRSPSAEIAQFVEKDLGETRRKKFNEQTSFGHEQVRDGISFGKEEERVTVVTYSDVQKLNDLQCYVTLPGDYPVVKLSMSYEAMPKVADALLLRDVQTSLDQTLEDEIRRRSEEERHKFAGLFEGESLIQAVPGGAFIPEGNLSNTPPPSADLVAAVLAEANTPPATWPLQTKGASGDADTGAEERTFTVLEPLRVPDNALRAAETFAEYTGSRTTPAGRTVVCTSVCPPSAVYWFSGQCSLTCLYCCFNQTKGIHMTNKQIALYAVISGCLSLSGPTFASSKGPVLIHSELPEQILAEPHAVPELVTTNVLLRQILAEVIKTNSLKEDKRCSDGEKNYSPGYIISVGNKTLRCDIAKDYPQWIEGDKA